MMFETLGGAAQGQLDRALAAKAEDPVAALTRLDKLAAQFMGDEIGTKAKTEAETLKKDPNVRKESEADTMWKQLDGLVAKLKPYQGDRDPQSSGFRKANAVSIQSILSGCQTLLQRYPGTAGAKKAQELMELYR